MANMNPKRNVMPTQEPSVRARNFDEVALGYSEAAAIDEAMRCLNCKTMPCVNGCPVKIRIPEFISRIKEGDFERGTVSVEGVAICVISSFWESPVCFVE